MFDFFKRKPDPAPPAVDSTSPASVATPAEPPRAPETEPPKRSWAERLKSGLAASRDKLGGALASTFLNKILD